MNKLIDAAGPYAKAVILLLALGVAVAAQAAGVDVGLDADQVWQQLGAAVLVFAVPNRPSGES